MNETDNAELNALTGTDPVSNTSANASPDDWKAKYEALEKELQQHRVEQGRLKKTNEELDQARKELAELKANHERDELKSVLSKEELDTLPEEFVNAATKLVSQGVGRIKAENDERMNRMEAAYREKEAGDRQNAARFFIERVDAKFPGFRASVTAGGDKVDAWASYLKHNKWSIKSAFENGDFDTYAYHVDRFYNEVLGVSAPSGSEGGSAAPEPRSHGGGTNGAPSGGFGKTYTTEEFTALYDELERARDKGDFETVKRLDAEINKAQAEGRVKD